MKLSNALGVLTDLRLAISFALLPTLKDVFRNPILLLRPQTLSRAFMANLWEAIGDGVDQNGRDVKIDLITPNAYGSVLDIGAGHGHSIQYVDRTRVSRYIALEPNVLMHERIRAKANEAGFHESDGTLIILSCGAEDTHSILSSISQQQHQEDHPVDTIISVLTLCTIPEPQRTISKLIRDILKPGGQLLSYEHVLSSRPDVAWWQRFWAPFWACVFDGCRMDRPSNVWIREIDWKEWKVWSKPGEEEENLFGHSIGKFIK
ncbi:hypothetical protein BYT27DRAFT_7204029 [Phlegmacium glaucopus]|nr:hypothetical protein BYT27DRAFT_7204029 [Phlegmacium glaucopus]